MRRTPQRAKIASRMSELVIVPAYRRSARDAARSLLVIANANASGHARLDPLPMALRRLGARVELARTGDVTELAAVWAQAPAQRVVLVGGDGTLHAAVNLPGPPRLRTAAHRAPRRRGLLGRTAACPLLVLARTTAPKLAGSAAQDAG